MKMKGQAKPDEFIWIFFAGMLAIVIMLFFWGTPTVEENQTINNTVQLNEPFTIGTYDQEVPRIIRIGDFSISHMSGSEIISTKKYIDVSKGVFDNKKFSFSAEIPENMENIIDGWINLYVLDGGEGRLLVKINDNIVYNQKTKPGKIIVPVEKKYLKQYNVIEISSSIPGIQFWSTSIYSIEKIEFGVNVYGNLIKSYDFLLYGSELKTFKKGEVKFNVEEREGVGNLIIKINGRDIFRGIPSGSFSKEFEMFDVGLINGVNTIEFSTEKDTKYKLDDVEVLINHMEKYNKSKTFSFVIKDSDFQKLQNGKKGKISFTIIDSDFNGNMILKIKDSNGQEHNLDYISSYSLGKNVVVYFGPNDVSVGTNYLTFYIKGDGVFTIANLDIIV
ncbi:MAG: hypothetical protein QW350_03530 [Candidatus Aenigmatarchaeota archaeon]